MKSKNIVCFVIFYVLLRFQLGAYHTLDLELNRKFTLTKDEWDSVALDRIETACDPSKVISDLKFLSKISLHENE